ncbi:NtaA/DmoA family FMN-dependent monooxygenase [Pimelobacter simplex]|uniref:Nitrilotriacetate monooxygenase component A n=1 Tax=Nocardioides simplex TaxID=2045 RepID=A0A0A1DRQ4_NOCSI|nr:LLM class flavin-dependent oxidoreductase [Pimelobacter simplex]AIY19312.1 Nitrilotriacetate monooxygenase component A [Pimelobacter simplex]MCG8149426.1 NtaA/DmoA family FMN-dependent monooxygenase [Pimelobacter simplex]GEB16203.1 monooxygenase [Pimelobacter simplex]SFM19264.1 FMN-dependent oxidoreductase, nitrilotriacetate monooxygenase family [Pimelobacter simplex]
MASKRQIHLGAVPYGTGGPGSHTLWLDPEIPGDASVSIAWFTEIARLAERGCFDLLFVVDSQFITPYSPPHYLNRLEPLTLLSALATQTSRIGLVGTATTSFNSPFNLVRRLGSLDLISGGRAGWNVVTTGDAGTATNYGLDEHYDYDTRYGRAQEFVELARALWDSYEDDAFVRDRASGVFLDRTKQHVLDHEGEHFKVRGPLNLVRSPQGHPVVFQAGDSDQGRDLGASVGEGIFTHAPDIPAGQAFYDDLKTRAQTKFGRDPDELVIMPGIKVVVGDTDEEARELEAFNNDRDHTFAAALAEFGRPFGWHDFTQYDLDAPFPAETLEHGRRSFFTQAKAVTERAVENGWTLRQTVEATRYFRKSEFVGSPATVADKLVEWWEARACDGFNVGVDHPAGFRRFVEEVVPILQERGVFRAQYDATTLRGHLGLPVPVNRHTAARAAAATTP